MSEPEAIERGLFAIIVAVVPFWVEPDRLCPNIHPGDEERFSTRGGDYGNDSIDAVRVALCPFVG